MIEIIKEVSKEELKDFLYEIDLKDKNLYSEINSKDYFGIFQFNGGAAEPLVKKIHPDNFEEMVAINSLARPGTIDFADEYNSNKTSHASRYPKKVSELIRTTYNVILFQEQVMSIFNKIGGFSLEETNEVRSLMKKLGKADKKQSDLDKWDATVNRFIEGAVKDGISQIEARALADDLLKMSGYSFNRSHAVAYSYIAAMTLYMSYYFRPYYYSSTLTYENERQKALLDRLNSCKQHGFKIYPPDVNRSIAHFAPDEDGIRFGLNEIKFVGENPAKIIIEKRPYTSVIDFIIKTRDRCMNKKVITALISMGAFDDLINKQRKKYILIADKYYEKKASIKVDEKLTALWNSIEEEVKRIPGLEMTDGDFVIFEEEYLGFNFFYSLFTDKVAELIYALNKKGMCETSFEDVPEYATSARVPVCVNSFRTIVDKNGKEMAFIDGSDMYGNKKSFPIFQSYWKLIKDKVTGKGIYLMNFFIDEDKKELYYGSKKWTDDATKSRMVKRII